MNDDLISRSALLAAYDKAHQGPPGGARKLIEEAPEALVRCKNCKYGEPLCQPWTDVMCTQNRATHNPGWFCADGERKQAEKTVNPG